MNRTFTIAALWLISGFTLAQNLTVGELLAGGGKQLSKEEVLSIYDGTTITGRSDGGADLLMHFKVEGKADGSVSGNYTFGGQYNSSIYGTWSVDDAGQACSKVKIANSARQNSDRCGFFYKDKNGKYYTSYNLDDGVKGAQLFERTITK